MENFFFLQLLIPKEMKGKKEDSVLILYAEQISFKCIMVEIQNLYS